MGASSVKSLFLSGSGFDVICSELFKTRKFYCSSKLMESKHAEESRIRQAVKKRMESFEVDRGHIIRSILECPFHKVVLDHLVVGEELVLKPKLVKSKVDVIMEDYVFNGIFSNVMCLISFEEMFGVVSNLPNRKVAGLSGITNELWKHCDNSMVEDALEKNRELWLVLQNMRKAYDSIGWEHLRRSLVRIRMCDRFIRFFGSIHNGRVNRVMTDFGLTNGYHVHNKSQSELTLFLATGAFVDDTIWVGSSQAATQYILDIANEFFRFNDISINNNKTVAILINCQIANPVLTVSGSPISIVKKREPHCYLDIFLSSEGLLRPSLAKAHSDVQFFVKLVLKKAISDKQFAYLVSSVLFSIVGYRTQFSFIPVNVYNKWNALICKGLKSKSGLPLDFPNDAFHYPSLYNLKTFEQVFSWRPHHPLLFPVHVSISPLDNFLAGVVHIFSRFPFWFDLSVHFYDDVVSSSICSSYAEFFDSPNVHQFFGFGVICNDLSNAGANHLSVYMNRFLCNLNTVNMKAGADVFFEDINSGLDTIALALKCISSFRSVDLFSDSQAALDVFKGHSGILDNKCADVFAKDATLLPGACPIWSFLVILGILFTMFSGQSVVCAERLVLVHGLFQSTLIWLQISLTYFMKALHYQLPVAVQKHLYNRCYANVVCLFCGNIKISDHIFFYSFDAAGYAQLFSFLCVSQLLSTCIADDVVNTVLCKSFVFGGWYQKLLSVFKDFMVAASNIVDFVCGFCVSFQDDIWLVCTKHQAFMKKNGLILCDGSIPVLVSGFSMVFSLGVVRLLDIADAVGIGFRFHKPCLFFLSICDIVSIYIDA
ncbi:hypothetical protein G9A89_011267 [Geosiphon pyriformis]|nr:hypothetical protein G9A89_011267 [Geosiphon pyriformis]